MIRNLTNMQMRLITGIVSAVIVIFTLLYSQTPAFKPFTVAFTSAIIGVAIWEFHQIAYAKEQEPAVKLSIFAGVVYSLAVALSTQYESLRLLPEITLLGCLIAFFAYYFRKGESPFINISISIFSFVYLAVPLSCILSIAYFFTLSGTQDGRWWVIYLLVVTKITDTAALFVGKKFGRQKFAPYISPKKTYEGALGGLIAAITLSFLITATAKIVGGRFDLTLWQSLWMGTSLGILAQFGDLAESLLKRDGGIKDSNQLPGLGGVLDIVDSLIFTSPFVYIFLIAYT